MADRRTPPRDVVAIDTETLSLHPTAPVWEFGAVRRYAGGEGHTSTTFMLAYPDLRNASQEALAVGRFYQRHPHAPVAVPARLTPSTFSAPAFARKVAAITHDAILLVNNPAFDVPRLELLLRNAGLTPGWWYHPVDVVDLARGRLAATLAPEIRAELTDVYGPLVGWGSTLVGQLLGIAPQRDEERHTALGDARWVLRLYDAALGQENPANNARVDAPALAVPASQDAHESEATA